MGVFEAQVPSWWRAGLGAALDKQAGFVGNAVLDLGFLGWDSQSLGHEGREVLDDRHFEISISVECLKKVKAA